MLVSILRKKEGRNACQHEICWNFVLCCGVTPYQDRHDRWSGQEPPFAVLACLRSGRNKKTTEVSLVCRILGNFINQPTSFMGAQRCSISRPLPRSALTKGYINQSASSPHLPPQCCIKLYHYHKNLYHTMDVKSLYQKTRQKPVNDEISAPPLCLIVSPMTFFFLSFLGIFHGETPTAWFLVIPHQLISGRKRENRKTGGVRLSPGGSLIVWNLEGCNGIQILQNTGSETLPRQVCLHNADP